VDNFRIENLTKKGKNMKLQFATILCAALLAAGCVSQQTYNTEVAKANTLNTANQQLNTQNQQLDALNQKLTVNWVLTRRRSRSCRTSSR
jgi:outer membrane murein-binding lipoprotein Lpp